MTPLMVAVISENHRAVLIFIKAGADVNASDDGVTALVLATALGEAPTVLALIEAGADLSTRFKGKTALEIAREKGFREIEELLVLHQGAPNSPSLQETPPG